MLRTSCQNQSKRFSQTEHTCTPAALRITCLLSPFHKIYKETNLLYSERQLRWRDLVKNQNSRNYTLETRDQVKHWKQRNNCHNLSQDNVDISVFKINKLKKFITLHCVTDLTMKLPTLNCTNFACKNNDLGDEGSCDHLPETDFKRFTALSWSRPSILYNKLK